MTLQRRIRTIIADNLSVDIDAIESSSSLTNDLGADSLDCVELLMAFEEEFGMEIPDEDAEKLQTVGSIERYLRRRGLGGEVGNDEEVRGEEVRRIGDRSLVFVPIEE